MTTRTRRQRRRRLQPDRVGGSSSSNRTGFFFLHSLPLTNTTTTASTTTITTRRRRRLQKKNRQMGMNRGMMGMNNNNNNNNNKPPAPPPATATPIPPPPPPKKNLPLPVIPAGFNGSDFLTLRFRGHAHPDNVGSNKISKVMLDVSQMDDKVLAPTNRVVIKGIHVPLKGKNLCSRSYLYMKSHQQFVVLHHYLGSSEQYFFRQDAREGRERSMSVRLHCIYYSYMMSNCMCHVLLVW